MDSACAATWSASESPGSGPMSGRGREGDARRLLPGLRRRGQALFDRLDRVLLRREQNRLAASILDRLPGAGQLDLLHTRVRDQERDAFVGQFVAHVLLPVF